MYVRVYVCKCVCLYLSVLVPVGVQSGTVIAELLAMAINREVSEWVVADMYICVPEYRIV